MTQPVPEQRPKAGSGPVPLTPVRTPAPAPAPPPVARPAGRARRRARHWGLIGSFVALVLLPTLIAGGYLGLRAADQYATTVGFAVRTERASAVIDLFGGLSQLSGASSTDAAMVYQYLQSPDLVAELDHRLDLRAMFARMQARDPVFGFDPAGSAEDLWRYWNRMVTVTQDQGAGILTLEVRAFAPADAQQIAQVAFEAASRMINALSDLAQDDAMRTTRHELALAEDRLRAARAALQAFRDRTRVPDPGADVAGQMGIVTALQDQQAAAMIALDMLQGTTRAGDPRMAEAERKLEAIRARIAEARQQFGNAAGVSYASLLGEFGRLSVDQEFAEKAYLSALAARDAAAAAARQKSLYLAAYQQPIRAETADYPRRPLLTALVAMFAFLIWSVGALVYYSLRDRR